MGRAAIIGCDILGCGWAARFLLNGWDVCTFDPDPAAADRVATALANARRCLPGLYARPLPPEGRLSVAASPAAAVTDADWVQLGESEEAARQDESLPPLARLVRPHAIIAKSGSAGGADMANAIVARACHPVYLLPLVGLAGDPEACQRAVGTLRGLGMWPAVTGEGAEPSARLMAAIARERSAMMAGGASAQEIDDALAMGPGLLMAQGRLSDFIEGGMPRATTRPHNLLPTEVERARDDALVVIIRALRRSRLGAGAVVAAHEATLALPERDQDGLPVTLCRQVPETWTDYNGHMSSHHYLETGSLAGDRFMELIGVDAAYISAGRSYFAVEDHVRYRAEIRAGDRITVTTQVLGGDGKRVHLFHFIRRGDGTLAATMETLLIHTDLTLRRACPPDPAVATAFAAWVAAHAHLDRPKDAGRGVSRQTG